MLIDIVIVRVGLCVYIVGDGGEVAAPSWEHDAKEC